MDPVFLARTAAMLIAQEAVGYLGQKGVDVVLGLDAGVDLNPATEEKEVMRTGSSPCFPINVRTSAGKDSGDADQRDPLVPTPLIPASRP